MIKKIVLSCIALGILLIVVVINNKRYDDITVKIELVNNDILVTNEINIPNNSTFYNELSKIYDLDFKDGFLYKIDMLEAYNNKEAYIAIYVNDEYSRYGIKNLKLKNNDIVSFRYTTI